MRLLDLPLLADENIHPAVVAALRAGGCDVITAEEFLGFGAADDAILTAAERAGRVVISHDSDLPRLWFHHRIGAVAHLRPGHIDPHVVLAMLDAANREPLPSPPPFLLTIDRRGRRLRLRFQGA